MTLHCGCQLCRLGGCGVSSLHSVFGRLGRSDAVELIIIIIIFHAVELFAAW